MCSMFFEFPVGSLKTATPGTRRNGLVRGRIRYRQPPDPQPHAKRRPDAARPSRAVVELYGARHPSPPRVGGRSCRWPCAAPSAADYSMGLPPQGCPAMHFVAGAQRNCGVLTVTDSPPWGIVLPDGGGPVIGWN